MARFMVIEDKDNPWPLMQKLVKSIARWHVCWPSDPIGLSKIPAGRHAEWPDIGRCLNNNGIEAILMPPFLRDGLVTAPYLLAIIRQLHPDVKVFMFYPDTGGHSINAVGLLAPFPNARLVDTANTNAGSRKLADAIVGARAARPGTHVFVDDAREFEGWLVDDVGGLAGAARGDCVFAHFNGAHELLINHVNPIAVVASDLKETGGMLMGAGFARVVWSSIATADIPVVIYSNRIYSGAERGLSAAMRPYDIAVELTEANCQGVARRLIDAMC